MKKTRFLLTCLLCLFVAQVYGQNMRVTGIVTDAANSAALPGVTVFVKGSNTSASSQADGSYTIQAPNNAILVFSYIGYERQEIAINSRAIINVALNFSNALDEVIVTALGLTRSQKSVGYATSLVKSEDLTAGKSSSLMSGIQGKVAGVSVSTAGGTGTSQKVIIRGYSSFGNNQPLYVVDGVPIQNALAAGTGQNDAVDFGNQAGDINPEDVESINILKGASATALYGSRAANGVIMITTKRAKESKLKVSYDGSFTGSDVLRVPQTQNMFGQGWPYWDPAENGSWGPKLDGRMHAWGAWATEDYGTPPDGYKVMQKPFSYVEDNLRNVYKIGFEMNNNFSVSAGNQEVGIIFSYGNTTSNGVLPNNADKFTRNTMSLRGNVNYKKFSADFNINYVRKDITQASAGQGSNGAAIFQELIQHATDVNLSGVKDWKDPNFGPDNYWTFYAENPYWVLDNNKNMYQDDRVYGKIELGYELISGLKAIGRLGGDFTNSAQRKWTEKFDYQPDSWSAAGGKSPLPGTYTERYDHLDQINADIMLTADYRLGDHIAVNGVLGYNYNQFGSKMINSYLYGLSNPGWFSLANGNDKPLTSSNAGRRRLIGVYGQADFSYKNFLYLTLSARNDWSSTLPVGQNSFFYGGVNTAIILTDWIKDLKGGVLDFLKVRAAWGKTGNDASWYQTASSLVPAQFSLGFGGLYLPLGGVPGLTISNLLGNSDLRPEITTEWEFGLTANFFDSRIRLDAAYYDKITVDQIVSARLAPETGYTTRTLNVGKIGNRGVELYLGLTPVRTRDFSWDINITYTKNWSEVKALWDGAKEYPLATGYQVNFVAEVGQPLGIFKVPSVAVVADGPMAGKAIVSASGLPTINPNTKDVVGGSSPDFTMGFNTRLKYKGITLGATLDWRAGGYMWCYTSQLLHFSGNATPTIYNERQPFVYPNSVKVVNGQYVENDIPVRWTNTYQYYNNASNYDQFRNWVIPKDFVKLRELVLSYDLPQRWLEKTFIGGLTLSLIGRNLIMWTPKENNYVDPETTNYGNDIRSELGEFAGAPSTRTFGGSIKITF